MLCKKINVATLMLLLVFCPSISRSDTVSSSDIISNSMSDDCIEWTVAGVCFWLKCTGIYCRVKTSILYRHYIPDLIVSSYAKAKENPWDDVEFYSSLMGSGNGERGSNNRESARNSKRALVFKNVDIIGSPGNLVFETLSSSDAFCNPAFTIFEPFYFSGIDSRFWQYPGLEMFYPEAIALNQDNIQNSNDLWGNLYPRHGFLAQQDGFKAAAVMASRAVDIVTRDWQPHIYWPALADNETGWWPPGRLRFGNPQTGKFQLIHPNMEDSCKVFPHELSGEYNSSEDAYAWQVWRPYKCCKEEGIFISKVEF